MQSSGDSSRLPLVTVGTPLVDASTPDIIELAPEHLFARPKSEPWWRAGPQFGRDIQRKLLQQGCVSLRKQMAECRYRPGNHCGQLQVELKECETAHRFVEWRGRHSEALLL